MYTMKPFVRDKFISYLGWGQDLLGTVKNPLRRNHSPLVVMFHGVNQYGNRDWGPWQYTMTPEQFDQQISRLVKKRTIISVNELTAWLIKGLNLPENPAIITFDDGYRDITTNILPVLKRYDVPATVYISTALAGDYPRAPFEQRLANALLSHDSVSVSHPNITHQTSLLTMTDVIECYNALRKAVKHSPPAVQEQLLQEVGEGEDPPVPIMNRDTIKTLSNESLITIGSHGHVHTPFATLPTSEQEKNITQSKEWLTNLLGSPPDHFSFPYGSFNQSTVNSVKKAGFKTSVTTKSRPVLPRDWNSPHRLPRFDACDELLESIL